MKKVVSSFLILCVFAAGFLTHALLFPDFLANGVTIIPKELGPGITPTPTPFELHTFMTKIDFDGEHFSRHNVTIEVGSYIIITNTNPNNQLMWLTSNNPQLATSRGYGQSEQVNVRLDTKGEYLVSDKNNPEERLLISVK